MIFAEKAQHKHTEYKRIKKYLASRPILMLKHLWNIELTDYLQMFWEYLLTEVILYESI